MLDGNEMLVQLLPQEPGFPRGPVAASREENLLCLLVMRSQSD